MKNTKARDNSGDDWKTPDWFYDKLNEKYHFDFDPCPYQADFDGLATECVWGKSNFINPPYSRVLKEKFILRAVEESKKGNLCVMLLPVSTSTKIFHEVILPNASSIEFVRGRLHFEQKNEEGKFVSKGAGQHDSMVVIFQKKNVTDGKNKYFSLGFYKGYVAGLKELEKEKCELLGLIQAKDKLIEKMKCCKNCEFSIPICDTHCQDCDEHYSNWRLAE